MVTSSGISPKGAAPRTKLRKGTHSCQECRIRKTRCVARPETPLTCVECLSRGVRCHPQDGSSIQTDDRPTLRDRVARLEHAVQTLQSERHVSPKPIEVAEKDVAVTISHLRSQALPLIPASSDLAASNSTFHDNPPLLSLFNNAVLRRKDVSSNYARLPLIQDLNGAEQIRIRRIEVQQALLSPLPPLRDLVLILEAAEGIWEARRRMFPEVDAYDSHGSLKEFVFWCLTQENPVYLAMALLCVATSLQRLCPRIDELSLSLSVPSRDLMKHYFELVDRLIIADNEYTATSEGINVIIFRAKCHFNLGQPWQCWLLFRQAISLAQVLGLTRSRKIQSKESQESVERRLETRRLRYQYDRYNSLLLGLPYAVTGASDDTDRNEPSSGSTDPSDMVYRKLYFISGRIIDRNQATTNPQLLLTLQIDQDLEDTVRAIPGGWWDIQSARSAGLITTSEYFRRIMAQFWYYQIKSFLHLPFMLESPTDQRVEYSHIACFDATRKLLGLYHVMRSRDDDVGFDMCKVIDFQGFTAAVLLLLGLLGYGHNSSALDLEQQVVDWQMIETTREILRRVSTEEGNSVAVQSLEVLEFLSAIRYENRLESVGQDFRWEGKLVILCFGTITISRGASFSKPSLQAAPQAVVVDQNSNLKESQAVQTTADDMESPGRDGFPFDTSYPHIDIDWQNMVNVDLDEDWGWNVDGMQT